MSPSIWQLLLVVLVIFVIFGAGKLPKVMGDLGKGIKNLKNGLKDGDEDMDTKNLDGLESKKDNKK